MSYSKNILIRCN